MFWWILGGVCLFLAITAFVIYLISEQGEKYRKE